MVTKGYQPNNPNDGDKMTDENAITSTDPQSLANARANAGIGVDGDAALSGAPAEEGGSGGSSKADDTTGRAGVANTGAAPAVIAGTGDADVNKSELQKESEEAGKTTTKSSSGGKGTTTK